MKKKMYLTALALVIAILISLPSVVQANLLTNPGFEDGDLTGWALWDGGGGEFSSAVVTGPSGCGGTYSDEISFNWGTDKEGVTYQQLAIVASQTYIFTADIMSSDISNAEAYLKIQFHTSSGYSPTGILYTSSELTAPGSWSSYSITATAPEDANYAEFGLVLDGLTSGGSGSVNFDNCDADVVPEPATLLLLGSGLVGLFGFVRRKR